MPAGSRTGPPPTQSNNSGRTQQTPHQQHTCTRGRSSSAQPHLLLLCVSARGNGRRTAAWRACAGPPARPPTLQTDPHLDTIDAFVVARAKRSQRAKRASPAPTLLGAGTGRACSSAAAARPGSQQVKPHASIDRAADARRQPGERVPCKCCLYVDVRENRGRRVRSLPLPTDRALDPILSVDAAPHRRRALHRKPGGDAETLTSGD